MQGTNRVFIVGLLATAALTGCGGSEPEFTVVEPMLVDDLIAQLPAPWNEKTPQVPDEKNGYVYLKRLIDVDHGAVPSGAVFEGLSERQERRQLEVFEPWFKNLETALAMEYWQAPLPEGVATLFPELPTMKALQLGLIRTSKLALKDGRADEAVRLLQLSDRFADSQIQAGGSVIHFLVGVALSTISERAVMEAAATKKLSSAQLRTLLATTDGKDLSAAMTKALRDEVHGISGYEIARSAFPGSIDSEWWAGDPSDSRFEDWEEALREIFIGHSDPFDQVDSVAIITEVYDELLRSLDSPYSSGSNSEDLFDERTNLWQIKELVDYLAIGSWTDDQIDGVKERIKNEPNPYGQLLVSIFWTPLGQLEDVVFRSWTNGELVRCVIGLRLYEAQTGGLPQRLEELVESGILTSVPQDRFTDRSLSYDPSRRRVWSVGVDLVDDGGSGEVYKFKPDIVVPF